jgi:hypothetical protein
MGAKLFYAGGRIDMTKLIVVFCNFEKAPKKIYLVFPTLMANVLQEWRGRWLAVFIVDVT